MSPYRQSKIQNPEASHLFHFQSRGNLFDLLQWVQTKATEISLNFHCAAGQRGFLSNLKRTHAFSNFIQIGFRLAQGFGVG